MGPSITSPRSLRSLGGLALLFLVPLFVAGAVGCRREEPSGAPAEVAPEEIASPALTGSLAPELVALPGGALGLTWIEPTPPEPAAPAVDPPGPPQRVRFARFDGASWSAPVTITEDPLFANWADRPGAFAAPDGTLFAHWLAMNGDGTYTYEVRLARSDDGGATWRPLGRLHDDDSPAEHGFVSWVADGGRARAVWLDGRATPDGGEMTLRTRLVGRAEQAPTAAEMGEETLLDAAVCDCCSTTAVATPEGPLVLYRDRTPDEVRDNFAVYRTAAGWSDPYPVHRDGWTIPACPVNGPVAAASGQTVWTAWFTGAGGEAKVLAAVSHDGGRTFGAPVTIDGDGPLGRLGMALLPSGESAVVSWTASAGERAAIHLRRLGPRGAPGPVVAVAQTDASRASGVSRVAVYRGDLVVAWVDAAGGEADRRIRIARLPAAALDPALPR